jgi:hypothetical protein
LPLEFFLPSLLPCLYLIALKFGKKALVGLSFFSYNLNDRGEVRLGQRRVPEFVKLAALACLAAGQGRTSLAIKNVR